MSTYKERYEERKKKRESGESGSSYKDRYIARKIESGELDLEAAGKDITNRVNTWFKNNENFVNNYNRRFQGFTGSYNDPYDSTINDWISSVTLQKSNFDQEANNIISWLDTYGDYIGGRDWADSVKNALRSAGTQQSEILKNASEYSKYWSQWESPDAYKRYQTISSIADMTSEQIKKYLGKDDPVAYIDDEGNEVTWDNLYKSKYYKELTDAEDFIEKGKYVSTYRGGEKFNAFSGTYTDSGFDDIMYDYINRNETAKTRQHLTDLSSNAALLGLDNSERGEMTQEEIYTFNYIYATQGSDAAYEYIDYLTSDLNARQREAEAAKWANFAKESPVGASVFSVIESPLKGLSLIGQIADKAADGVYDENAGYNKFSYVNSAIRNEVSDTVEKKWGGVGTFAYQTGMSMADFLFNTAMSGGNSAVSLAIMGTGTAADTVIASKDRGLEDWQAFTLGAAAGAIEVVTEKIGIDALFDAAKLGKGAVGYILSNIFAEAGEEGLSNIGNLITDLIVAQDKSEWVMSLEAYKADGLSDKEAWGKVITDHLVSLGLDVLGGAISGGFMGGGGAAIGAINNTIHGKEYKETFGADIGSALAGKAVEIDPNSKFAQKMQAKVEGGGELSNRQVGKLVQQNETAMRDQDVSALRESVTKRLTELGESGDVSKISEAIVKQKTGEKLSVAEKKVIEGSKFGQRVATEEENVGKGTHTSAWAEEYHLDRAAAREDYLKALKGNNAASVAVKNAEGLTEAREEKGATYETPNAKVKEISSVKDGKITVKLESGEVVDASEVDFGNEDVALVYRAAAEMSQGAGYNEDTVKVLVNGFESSGLNAAEYLHAFRDSFNYGAAGTVSVSALEKGKYTSLLSEKQRELAFHLGKAFGEESAQRAEQERARIEKEKTASAEKGAKAVETSGGVIFDGSVNQGNLSKAQNAQIKVLQSVSSALGAKIRLFASEATVTEDGRRTRVFSSADGEAITANGWYDNETGEIWIDVNAGVDGNGLILFTAAHELTHFIKDWSSEKYNAFANFLISQYAEKGVSVDELIEAQIEKAAKRGREMTREEAFDEVVADSCESFLADSNAAEKIAALNEKDATFAEKIKSYIHKLLVKIRNLLKGIDPDSEEGKIVRGMTDSLEQLYELWTDALADAGQNYGQADMDSEKGLVQYSERIEDYDKPISFQDIELLRSIGRKSINKFTSEDIKKAQKWAYKFYQELGVKSPFFRAWFGDWRAYDENRTSVHSIQSLDIAQRKDADVIIQSGLKNKTLYRGNVKNSDTEFEINIGAQVYNDTLTYANRDYSRKNNLEHYAARISILKSIKDIVESAILLDTSVINDKSNPNRTFMHYFYNVCEVNGTNYLVKLGVDEINSDNGAIRRAYNVNNIKISPIAVSQVYKPAGTIGDNGEIISTISIAQLFEYVNTYDDNFSPVHEVSEHVLNRDGTPKEFYHGTNESFTAFSYREIGNATGVGILGDGFYFTDKKPLAKAYGKNVMPCYLKMEKPYIASASEAYTLSTNKLLKQGYDGVILNAPKGSVYLVFENTQIKSATDNIGTFDSKNPDIRYSERDPDAISSREVLANALEGAVQNDIEAERLAEYKSKIAKFDAEEQKLRQLRAEIKELSFAPGKRDNARLAELRAEAEKTANRINIYDKQLLRLEASKPLEGILQREKQKAYNRAKAEARADFDKYRARAQKSQEELKARYQESKRRGVEGRHKTEVRHKIQGIVSELNTLLLNPTAKKHIKEELRRGVAEALSAFNMDTIGAEERLAEINRKLQAETDREKIDHLLESYKRIMDQDANLKVKLEKLNTAYEKIKDTDDIELNLAYQEVIQNSIKAVSEKVGDTSIRDMTLEQLEMVYDLFKMIRHTIRDANKAFKTKKGETITQMAEAVNDQVRTVAGQPYQRNFVKATLQRMGWTFLKPYVAFRTIGSETLVNRYRELREGEDTFYSDIREAQTFIEEQYEKYGFKSWDMKETREFKAKSGKSFELTLEQMMTLYAYSKREQAHAHIMEGGIVFEDALVVKKNKLDVPVKYEVTTKDAFNLSVETFTEITSSLTEEQKAFVDAMQAYLSEDMGAKGNEISMQLLGVKLFKEKFYLPIKSSQYYMNFKAEEAGEVKLRSPAFSKETVHHANNPIVLHNFTDLWAEHINDMAMYHSFVLALEDFTRVYNYKTKTGADTETMDTKATLETAYPGVTKYINKFLKDMNGGVRGETVGWAEKMTSLAKKGSVLGSASVTIQQPSAVMRAMAYIDPKYFVGEKVSEGKHKEKWEELKKYAPIAGIKEMGRFDVGMGASTTDLIKADKNILEKGEEWLSLPPAFMDEVTWLAIWDAVKRETAHNYPKLATSSDAFKTLAGERFTDVISLSQVYDSVFSRSDIMRNKSWIAKSLTAFMAEPTTTLNMLWDSAVQGKRTGSTKGFVATTASTGGAVFAAIFTNSLLKSFVMAMRDDDEDESYAEKYLEHFVGDFKDNLNPLNLIPFVKDILSIFKGYDVERMDMALFSDLKNAIDAFDSDNKTLYEKWSGLIGAVAAFRGLPFKNIERDVRALFNTFFGKREETTLEGMLYAIEKGWTGEEKSDGQQLYEAMLKGDTKHIERVKARFEDQNAIEAAVYKALKENDIRVKEAAKARGIGDIAGYTEIAKEIVREGIFSQDNVVAAINSEIRAFSSKITEAANAKLGGEEKEYKDLLDKLIETYDGVYSRKEIEDAITVEMSKPQKPTDSDKIKSIYVVEDFYKAVRGNDLGTAYAVREDIIGAAVDNGKSQKAAEQAFESSITTFVGDKYKSGLISDADATRILTEFGGKTEAEASSKIRYWAFVAENPEYNDFTESAVNKYYDGYYKMEDEEEVLYCKSAQSFGITLDVYAEYVREKSGLTKKEDIMYIINTLPLTKEQKDALYYLNGWAKSTIREAPWR